MSEADKLLNALGFNIASMEEIKFKKKTRQWREDGELEITFNEDRTIDIGFGGRLPVFIAFEELQAINAKVKELGWE